MTELIDVHHHIIPDAYREALASAGIRSAGGRALSRWSPEDSLQFMDRLGIEKAYVSISEPAVYPLVAIDPGRAAELCRKVNEGMAEMKEKHPGRFGAFALLPMPDVERSIEELHYALDVLHLDGAGLLSNYCDQFLGDSVFDSLMQALNDRAAVVYVHPSVPPRGTARPQFVYPDFMQEFCFNTARAAANLMMSGTMESAPSVRFVFSHMGGVLPYLRWRLATSFPYTPALRAFFNAPEAISRSWEKVKQNLRVYMGRMWFDTALATDPYVYQLVNDTAPGHVVFGTDSFFAPEILDRLMIQQLNDMLPKEEFLSVARRNAEVLFARPTQKEG